MERKNIIMSQQAQKASETSLQITGMTCAACAVRIEKGINKVDGVMEANVNLALEKATVKFDPAKTNVQALQDKVRDLGYDVVSEKVELDIIGMTCAACSTRIEKGLNKVEGVSKASVNLALEKGSVEYDPTTVTVQQLIKKVESLGYEAKVKEEGKQQNVADLREKEIENQKGKFAFSLILSIPLL